MHGALIDLRHIGCKPLGAYTKIMLVAAYAPHASHSPSTQPLLLPPKPGPFASHPCSDDTY